MKSIKEQYISLKEGNMSQANFMRNIRMTLPQHITNTTSYTDSLKILRNKGILTEIDIYGIAGNPDEEKEMKSMSVKNYNMDPDQLKRGIEVEMEHTDDQAVAEKIAMDHLKEDPEYYSKLDSVGLEEANPGIDPTLEDDFKRLESSKSIYNIVSKDNETAVLEDENGTLYAFQYFDKKDEIQPYENESGEIDDEAIKNYINDNEYALSKGIGMSDWEGDKDIVEIDDSLRDNFSSLLDTLNENDEEELSPNMKHIKNSMGSMDKPEVTPERRAELEKIIKDKKEKEALKENKTFQEIDTVNSQELLIGIDCEMQKNANLNKREAAKIAIKKIKKIPNYYTMAYLSGEEGTEPQYLGGKSAEPEARQMKPYSADKVVDKKMGMQTVKGVNKVKSSANKAYKETNTIVKGVEELNFIAKKAAGIKQRFEPTSSTMKVVREVFKNNKKLNENVSFNEIKDLLTKISQENNLFIYNKETDLDGLKNAIKINKSIPKSGIIAVDSLTDTNYVFVVSKDKTLNDKVNQEINQSEEFESHSGRTDDLDNGIILTLLTVGKKQQISETIDQMLTKERLKEVIRKELKNIKK